MDKWAELRTAYMVAKLGTVSAASEALGFHRATVNRHIDILERELGTRIFIRHAKGYALTEIGEEVLRVAQKTEELIEDFSGRVKGGNVQVEGEIKISLLPHFAKVLLEPIVQFRTDNPGCQVMVTASEDLARLEYGEAHIALRAGSKPDTPDYVVKSFGRVGLNLYAHDSYIERKGMPGGEDDLTGHEFVVSPELDGRVPVSSWVAENILPSQISVSSRHYSVITEAVLAGLGLGFLSDIDAVGRTDVHEVLPKNQSWEVPLWLVTHVDLHRTEKVQAMLKCLNAVSQPQP